MAHQRRSSRSRKQRKGKQIESRIPWLKLAILALLTVCLAVGGFALYYYAHFNRLIDARIKARVMQEGAIYSAPTILVAGQRADRDEIRALLNRLDYEPHGDQPSGYRESESGFEFVQDGRRFQVQLTSDNRIRRLELNGERDRKSTRLNSSHVKISYAVFCLKKKKYNV